MIDIPAPARPGTVPFLGLPIADHTLAGVVDAVFAAAAGDRFGYVVTPNVDHVVRLDRACDSVGHAFVAAYGAAEMILCDSRILRRLARASGVSLPLVPGSDLTAAVLSDPRAAGRSVAIIGGGEGLVAALGRQFPAIRFVQCRPPMNVARDPAALATIARFVADTRADIVLFSIGAPQSEIAAHRCLLAGSSRGIGLCVGAALEFLVGDKRRAPQWMQRMGIEWAFRLSREPRRLWRRYLIEGPRIFAIWARRR